MTALRRVCVFCGSSRGTPAVYREAAEGLARTMVTRGIGLVFGGGGVGLMGVLADAVLATFEEFCEAVTWTQLGLHRKRCGLLNAAGFYDLLLALFDRAVADGFLRAANRSLVADDTDPAVLLDKLSLPLSPPEPKWIRTTEET